MLTQNDITTILDLVRRVAEQKILQGRDVREAELTLRLVHGDITPAESSELLSVLTGKIATEEEEFLDALDRGYSLEALAEAADVIYQCVKVKALHIDITSALIDTTIRLVVEDLAPFGMTIDTVVQALVAKYTLRATGAKNHAAELAAIQAAT